MNGANEGIIGRPSATGKGRLTGPQRANPFKPSKTLNLPYDTMCPLWVTSEYSCAVAGVRS